MMYGINMYQYQLLDVIFAVDSVDSKDFLKGW
jgi:hypothetical protein